MHPKAHRASAGPWEPPPAAEVAAAFSYTRRGEGSRREGIAERSAQGANLLPRHGLGRGDLQQGEAPGADPLRRQVQENPSYAVLGESRPQ